VYPDAEARGIAQRTKTLVLSGDVTGSDMRQGTLYTYDADQKKSAWHGDALMLKEWERWSEQGKRAAAEARIAAPGNAANRDSTAPLVRSETEGMKVSVGDLEEKPAQYLGKTVSVTAEVEEVFGPRLFKIDEPNWADLDGEVLVYMASNLAALVREGDRITVTGTPKTILRAELERELGWFDADPELQVEFATRPVVVASRVVGGNSDMAIAIGVTGTSEKSEAVGTTGASGTSDESKSPSGTTAITSATALDDGERDLVGRRVLLENLKVTQAAGQGFWVKTGQRSLFVLPTPADRSGAAKKAPSPGQTVTLEGVILEMPKRLRDKADGVENANELVYIYASHVK
jgi:hypothetical protein